MNDFSELENDLKRVRPDTAFSRAGVAHRTRQFANADSNQTTALTHPLDAPPVASPGADAEREGDGDQSTSKMRKVSPRSREPASVGLGLLRPLLSRLRDIRMEPFSKRSPRVAPKTPCRRQDDNYISVIFPRRDQVTSIRATKACNLPAVYEGPMRRILLRRVETWQWRNPKRGS